MYHTYEGKMAVVVFIFLDYSSPLEIKELCLEIDV